MLKYPLPSGDQCRYSYNSRNAHVHGVNATILGRPGMTDFELNKGNGDALWARRISRFNEKEWDNVSNFQGRNLRVRTITENLGLARMEQWQTMEDWTG